MKNMCVYSSLKGSFPTITCFPAEFFAIWVCAIFVFKSFKGILISALPFHSSPINPRFDTRAVIYRKRKGTNLTFNVQALFQVIIIIIIAIIANTGV